LFIFLGNFTPPRSRSPRIVLDKISVDEGILQRLKRIRTLARQKLKPISSTNEKTTELNHSAGENRGKTVEIVETTLGNSSENHIKIKNVAKKSCNGHAKTNVLSRNKTATTQLVEISKKFVEQVNRRKRDANTNEKNIQNKTSKLSNGQPSSNEVEITCLSHSKVTRPTNSQSKKLSVCSSEKDSKCLDKEVQIIEKSSEDSAKVSSEESTCGASDVKDTSQSSSNGETRCDSPKTINKEENDNNENYKAKENVAVVAKVAQDYAKSGAQTEKIIDDREQTDNPESASGFIGESNSEKKQTQIHFHYSWTVYFHIVQTSYSYQ